MESALDRCTGCLWCRNSVLISIYKQFNSQKNSILSSFYSGELKLHGLSRVYLKELGGIIYGDRARKFEKVDKK
jgi:hypothetical protein